MGHEQYDKLLTSKIDAGQEKGSIFFLIFLIRADTLQGPGAGFEYILFKRRTNENSLYK